ncbi:hypothetical protein A2U01_0075559, partial [Trifolium medium]|nr:hypothetical protein [Trifolium medium]
LIEEIVRNTQSSSPSQLNRFKFFVDFLNPFSCILLKLNKFIQIPILNSVQILGDVIPQSFPMFQILIRFSE